MARAFSFDAVFAPDARVLVLGSMPGIASLDAGWYYAHPRNAFWPILCEITGNRADNSESQRTLALRCGLAIWDVLAQCERTGSLDSAIRNGEPNDIPGLLAQTPDVGCVLLNGGKAYELYARHFVSRIGLPAVRLPSTSPAMTMPYARKLVLWRDAYRAAGLKGIQL